MLILCNKGFTQCTAPNCTPSATTGYCAEPDTIQNLPISSVGVAYDTDIKFKVANSVQGATIINLTIDNLSGLPTGFNFTTSPSTGIIPGGSFGCINISGTATSGQEFGGVNSDGVYPLLINATANVTFFGNPNAIPVALPGYKLIISDPTLAFILKQNEIRISPNPARDIINIVAGATTSKQIKIYNALGQSIKTINDAKAINRINVSDLHTGIYFIEITTTEKVIIEKFVKE